MFKKFLLVIPAILLVTMACRISINAPEINVDSIAGSGNVVTEERAVSGFDQVELRGIGELSIIQGETEALTIEAEDNVMEYITTEVSGGKLVIGMKEHFSFSQLKPIHYTLTVKDLSRIELSGFGNAKMDGFKADTLSVQLSGSGNLELEDLELDQLDLVISGFGGAEVSGTARSQNVELTGSGNYKAGDLQSSSASVRVSGFGSATVWAEEDLDVEITGSGNVRYFDNPRLSQDIDGFGKVESLGSK